MKRKFCGCEKRITRASQRQIVDVRCNVLRGPVWDNSPKPILGANQKWVDS